MDNTWFEQFHAALFVPELPVPVEVQGHTAVERFAVHRNTVVMGMIEILQQIFPTTKKLLGVDFFQALAGVFVRRYPMRSAVAFEYGEELPAFLADFPPMADWAWVADVAQLEWLHQQSLNAADCEALDVLALQNGQLANVENCMLETHSSLRLARFTSPAFGIWHQQQSGDEDDTFNGEWAPQNILLWRSGSKIRHQFISDATALFIEAILQGHSLADATVFALPCSPEFSLETALAELFTRGLVVGIKTPGKHPVSH